jgi:hypothetical protein
MRISSRNIITAYAAFLHCKRLQQTFADTETSLHRRQPGKITGS